MSKTNSSPPKEIRIDEICFGLNRKTDEQSLAAFIQRFADNTLLDRLIPKLDNQEITVIVDFLTALMQKHFTEKEYHKLFLK